VAALKLFAVIVEPSNTPGQLALRAFGLVTQAGNSQVSLAIAHGIVGKWLRANAA
jgi:hypothetical protein